MNSLLENAVISIQLGLEDFSSDDERRIISAARNLYAGVLLLCKEVLRRLSPPDSNDILIRTGRKVAKDTNGDVRFIGDGKKTISGLEITKTFKELQLSASLSNLKRLADIRNDIEHMHPRHAPALIQEAIADAMPIIRDVIVNELHEEPSALLGERAWDALLSEAQVFNEEQGACNESFSQIAWGSNILATAFEEFQCPNCSSILLLNNNLEAKKPADLVLICSKCGKFAELSKVIELALQASLSVDQYIAVKQGGDSVLEECPECFMETFVVDGGLCLNPECGFHFQNYKCSICHKSLTLDDYSNGDTDICGYHAYIVSKDD